MKRYLGIDFGQARVGIAKSDLLGFTAEGVETIKWDGHDIEPVLNRIELICKELDVSELVLGLPKRTDNRAGEAEEKVRDFADKLADRLGLPLHFEDERLTTVMATKFLQQGNSKKSTYRSKVDQVAAEIILQGFLEKQRFQMDKINEE